MSKKIEITDEQVEAFWHALDIANPSLKNTRAARVSREVGK